MSSYYKQPPPQTNPHFRRPPPQTNPHFRRPPPKPQQILTNNGAGRLMFLDNGTRRKYLIRKPSRNFKFFTPLSSIVEDIIGESISIDTDTDRTIDTSKTILTESATYRDENIMIIDTDNTSISNTENKPNTKRQKLI